MSNEQKVRYFTKQDDISYQVSPEIRQHIVFAQHNIIRDAPFTKTHMISCRNMLIYLNQETQKKVLSLLAFSLKHQGLLFLGPSETLGRHANDFRELDTTNKIYQKLRETNRRLTTGFVLSPAPRAITALQASNVGDQLIGVKSKKALNILLQRYVPPSILINSVGDVLHTFGDAGRNLVISPGESSLNLKSMVSGQAKAVVAQMLNHVNKTRKSVCIRYVEGFAGCETADIELQPMTDAASDADYYLVTITPNEAKKEELKTKLKTEPETIPEALLSSRVTELEEELQFTRESLQTTIEELETSNEELQSSNEELMAANEELQSTNEELQSVNEELVTVNGEFQAKEKERAEIAADEKSIIEASGIGILFLDEKLHIRKFSDTAANIFHLVPGDFNRPLGAVSGNLVQNITPDIRQVLEHSGVVEKEVFHENGSVYQMCIHRLETVMEEEHQTTARGVILTFLNITKLSLSQRHLKQSERRFQAIVDAMTDGYFEWNPNNQALYLSKGLKRKLGYTEEQTPLWNELLSDESKDFLDYLQDHAQYTAPIERMLALRTAQGDSHWMIAKCRLVDYNHTTGAFQRLEGQFIDMQHFKRLESDLQQKMDHLKRSNDLLEEFAYIVSHDLKAPLRHSLHNLEYLIQARTEDDQMETDHQIKTLQSNLKSLQTLIDDVIRFLKFRTQKKNPAWVDLNEIIDKIYQILKVNFQPKVLNLKCDRIPKLACDHSMMNHLFQNLLHNACKYNDKPYIDLSIHCEDQKDHIIITVKDNGIGFDQRFTDDIFKPFRRLVTKNQYEGSGVGLAICKTIVEQHNGTISVRSKPKEGSEFIVKLPKLISLKEPMNG